MRYAIIGNGPAGVTAAETLRKVDPEGQIVLIGDEPEPPYSRMALPYLLVGKIDEAGTYLRKDPEHFRSLKVELVTARVDRVDVAARKLTLNNGATLGYDKLLVATGAHSVTAPIPGVDLPGVNSCWTLEDARKIAARLKPGAEVVLMGAGFVGCIVLEALAKAGAKVTVIASGNRMVPRMMTEVAGSLIAKWCGKKGIKVYTKTRVASIEPVDTSAGPVSKFLSRFTSAAKDSGRLRVTLNNGDKLEADLVIKATGVRSNIEFLKDTGIATDTGILVDECLQSSIPDVYAAGDCAQSTDFSTGASQVHAIQPTAVEQGRVAAQNMAGIRTVYQGSLSMNVLDTVGLVSSSYGLWMGVEGGQSVELVDEENFKYLRLEFKDDVLVGATSLGLTQHVGVLRGLIQSKVRLGKWKDHLIADPTRIMEAYIACTQAPAVPG